MLCNIIYINIFLLITIGGKCNGYIHKFVAYEVEPTTDDTKMYTNPGSRNKRFTSNKLFDDKLDILGMVDDSNRITIHKVPSRDKTNQASISYNDRKFHMSNNNLNEFSSNVEPILKSQSTTIYNNPPSATNTTIPQYESNQLANGDSNYYKSSHSNPLVNNLNSSYLPEISPIPSDILASTIPQPNSVSDTVPFSLSDAMNGSIIIGDSIDTNSQKKYIKKNAIDTTHNINDSGPALKIMSRSIIADHSTNNFAPISGDGQRRFISPESRRPKLKNSGSLFQKFKNMAKQNFEEILKLPNKYLTVKPTNTEMLEYQNKDPIVWRRITGVCKIYLKFITAEKLEKDKLKRISKILNGMDYNSKRIVHENNDQLLKYEHHRRIFKYWCFSLRKKYHRIAKQLQFIEEFLNTIDEIRVVHGEPSSIQLKTRTNFQSQQ